MSLKAKTLLFSKASKTAKPQVHKDLQSFNNTTDAIKWLSIEGFREETTLSLQGTVYHNAGFNSKFKSTTFWQSLPDSSIELEFD